IIQLICDILSAIFCGAIVYLGYFYVQNQIVNNVLSMGMSWPVWLYGIWLPIGGAVLCIRQIQLAVKTFIATLHHGKEETA
uniref:TRAP transporter small permease n=1 Tax=Candidatus Scatomorpha intestinigallinarum TaxID=2840923 RepID=UPI004025E5BF